MDIVTSKFHPTVITGERDGERCSEHAFGGGVRARATFRRSVRIWLSLQATPASQCFIELSL